MHAIRSRNSSTSNNSSSSASFPMRSVRPQLLFRSSRAAARPRRVPHNGKGTPWLMCRTNSLSWRKVSPPRYCRLSFDLREEVFGATDGGRVVYGTLGRGRTHHTLHTVMILILMHKTGGKRTFSSLVSKVKAKVQELDQSRYGDLHPPFFFFATPPPPPPSACTCTSSHPAGNPRGRRVG
jgi:hypothetical protein